MFTNRCKEMIYIRKIRPLSELHSAVCLSVWDVAPSVLSSMAPQRVQGTAVGPRRVSLEARDPGPQRLGYRRDFHSRLLVILSAQISLEAHI